MSRHVMSCHVTSRHVVSCQVMWSCAHVRSSHLFSCHAVPWSCHVLSCHLLFSHVMSCHAASHAPPLRPVMHVASRLKRRELIGTWWRFLKTYWKVLVELCRSVDSSPVAKSPKRSWISIATPALRKNQDLPSMFLFWCPFFASSASKPLSGTVRQEEQKRNEILAAQKG